MKRLHTSGPWLFEGECEPLPVRGTSQFQVWDAAKRPLASVVSDEDTSIGVTEGIANARLIAAAPTLLSVLTSIRDNQRFVRLHLDDQRAIRDAIMLALHGKEVSHG